MERFISKVSLPLMAGGAVLLMWYWVIHKLIDGLAKAVQ